MGLFNLFYAIPYLIPYAAYNPGERTLPQNPSYSLRGDSPSHGSTQVSRNNVNRRDAHINSPIIYPTPTSYYAVPEGYDRLCFTFDGRNGKCKRINECRNYLLTHSSPSSYSERLAGCGVLNHVCCPDVPVDIYTTNKPSSNSFNVHLAPENGQVKPPAPEAVQASLRPENVHTESKENNNPDDEVTCDSILSNWKASKATNGSANTLDLLYSISAEAQKVCGVFDPKQQSSWPWVVSLGRKEKNLVEWDCLGSIITNEYVLTTANCLQRSPNVVGVGMSIIGVMAVQEEMLTDLKHIADSYKLDKFVFPGLYKNLGMVRLAEKVNMSVKASPICFPFLAGVLDIIDFSGASVKSLDRKACSTRISTKDKLHGSIIEEVKVVNNSHCSQLLRNKLTRQLKDILPKGMKRELMCTVPLSAHTNSCSVEGSPLAIYDKASRSYVQIGIASGQPGCQRFEDNPVHIYTRVNSFSSWVRDNVGELPTPLPCYV